MRYRVDDLPPHLALVEVAPNGCWDWMGSRLPAGYGRLPSSARTQYTHRLSYEHFVGPIPDGQEIDHLCRRPMCCRPDHLEAVPPRINKIRSMNPCGLNARKTHCVHGHEFTDENTRVTPNGPGQRRRCRTCERAKGAARRRQAGIPVLVRRKSVSA